VSTLNDCLIDILLWMEACKLKLNADNTDLIFFLQNNNETKLSAIFQLSYLVNDTSPSETVQNLGIVFDSDFGFQLFLTLSSI